MSSKTNIFGSLLLTAICTFYNGQVAAEEHTLSCKLYNASSTAGETLTQVKLDKSAQTLAASRTASFCIFDDGTVAEKQFVNVQRAVDDGASGIVRGISVYTLPNGDSITATFVGDWSSAGFVGAYEIVDGTGTFINAKGDGSFTGAESPWATSQMFDVVLNVSTP